MRTTFTLSLLIVVNLIAASVTLADIARPKPSPLTESRVVLHTSLTIEPDFKATEAKLQIRQSDLQVLRAALNSLPGDTSIASSVSHSSTRTIVAGLLLFVSISFAGVWLARSRSNGALGRRQKTAVGVFLVAVTLGAAAIITRGNAGPPGYYNWRNLPKYLAQGESTSGSLDIEIIPDKAVSGTSMKLIIPLRK